MGFLDRLFGREEPQPGYPSFQPAAPAARSEDELAVERYRYLLRTAPPEAIERVHEEAFGRLTPEQRRLVFQQLSENAPPGEQPRGEDPQALAQAATRSELLRPGTMERSLAGQGSAAAGPSFGSMVGGSLLGTVAGFVIGSTLMSAFLPADLGSDAAAADAGANGTEAGGDTGSAAGDSGGDVGGDFGGGFGDFGGDFGGGDFGV